VARVAEVQTSPLLASAHDRFQASGLWLPAPDFEKRMDGFLHDRVDPDAEDYDAYSPKVGYYSSTALVSRHLQMGKRGHPSKNN
jgi:hypothetical protein